MTMTATYMRPDIESATLLALHDMSLRDMSPRTKKHYDRVIESMYERQTLWGGNLTVIDDRTKNLSATGRRTLAFEKVLDEMPIHIEPYALLAGYSEKNGQVVRCMLPSFILPEESAQCSMGIAHKCPDYETLLAKGFSGILDDLEASMKALLATPEGVGDIAKAEFYEAVRRECLAVIRHSNRYADLAERSGLTELARICRRVPEYGAQSFHEAVQSMWFYNHCIHETMTKLSIGHIDRILEPYFIKDYESGALSLEQAQEIVDEFNLRVNDRVQIDPDNYVVTRDELEGAPDESFKITYGQGFSLEAESDDADAINHWGQNILISGLRPDGSDGTNPLTYMFLNAHEKFQLTGPVLTVRLHKNSPPELVDRVAEVLRTGGGMPFINNDDVIIPAYERLGIPHEDACLYANSNCWETLIQGKGNQEMIRFVNFLHLLELALNNGEAVIPGPIAKNGVKSGDISGFTSVEDIIGAWKKQLDYRLESSMAANAAEIEKNGTHGLYTTIPVLSALTRDCVERLTDLTHGGARYVQWHMMAEAVSNAADALSAIKKHVFDDKRVSLKRLVEILRANWDGESELRVKCVNDTPRYGNDESTPDGYAKEMVDYFVERVTYYAAKHKACIYSPCIGTFSWIIGIGKRIGASADGRGYGEPIAANASPVPGADLSGPTAAINSYLKLRTNVMAAGAPLDLRLNKRGLEGESGIIRIGALIKTFIQQGGNMLTLTVTDAEELRKAIAEPLKYRNLRVRMGGWTAYFVLLSKEAQAIQLRRTEHGF